MLLAIVCPMFVNVSVAIHPRVLSLKQVEA